MKINDELIEKFLKDQCTEAEAEFVYAYLEQFPGELEKYLPLQNLMAEADGKTDPKITAAILKNIRVHYHEKPVVKFKPILWYAVAASMVGLIILTGGMLFKKTGKATFVQAGLTKQIDSLQALKTIQNNTERVINTLLPDNSTVNVYPGSKIEYLPAFEKTRRIVNLKGKAKFSIKKGASNPFIVYTSGIAVTVLGTSFIVSEMNSKQTSVKLIEGSIKVASRTANMNAKSVILKPGDELVVSNNEFDKYTLENKRTVNNKIQDKPATKLIAEKEDKLAFKNQQLKEVFRRIEKRFNVVIKDETDLILEQKLFTGTFLEEDGLEFIIKMICNLNGLQYKIEHDTVFIIK